MSTGTLRKSAASPAGMAERHWDVIVIGAGVGGAAMALGLAGGMGRDARVLLVERSEWPRSKVCGCCLNHAAVQALGRLGVVDRVRAAGAVRIDQVELRCKGSSERLQQPEGLAISRSTLDGLLVEAAISAGAAFMPQSSAVVLPRSDGSERAVELRTRGGREIHGARLVVAADGLGGCSLGELPEFRVDVRPGSWMGAGALLADGSFVPPGVVQMNVGRHGYVGLVRLDERRTNVGAALDPRWVKEVGGPGPAVGIILEECGAPEGAVAVRRVPWTGTPLLTRRRRRVAAPGVMVIGDAAGYVEPFTGEGMMWALASAEAATELAVPLLGCGAPSGVEGLAHEWARWHAESIIPRQRVCGLIRSAVHRPWLFGMAVRMTGWSPRIRRIGGGVCEKLSAPMTTIRATGVSA